VNCAAVGLGGDGFHRRLRATLVLTARRRKPTMSTPRLAPRTPHHQAARWRHDGDESAPVADPADLGTAFGLELSLANVARAQPLPPAADEPPSVSEA
jgi:hypothetical protein